MSNKFKVGDKVVVVDTDCCGGNLTPGDVGVVTHYTGELAHIYFDPKTTTSLREGDWYTRRFRLFEAAASALTPTQELAAKYARQVEITKDLWKTVELAEANYRRESDELNASKEQLKALIDNGKRSALIPIGHKRNVLVQFLNDSLSGAYKDISIIEETT